MAIDGADLRSPLLLETVQLDPQGGPGAALWRGWLFGPSVVLVQPAAAVATVDTATPAVIGQNYILAQPAAAAVTIATSTPVVGTSGVSTLVVYADLSSGSLGWADNGLGGRTGSAWGKITSSGGTYAQNRAGTGGTLTATNDDFEINIGNAGGVSEGFVAFDTSDVPEGARIGYVALTCSFPDVTQGLAPVIEARAYDWGATVTGADFVPGDSLAALPLVAHCNTGDFPDADVGHFIDDGLADYIVRGGTTKLLLAADSTRLSEPTGDNRSINFVSDPVLTLNVYYETDPAVVVTLNEGSVVLLGSAAPDNAPYDGYLAFDTSALGADATVTAATLTVYDVDYQVRAEELDARLSDWGVTLTGDDAVSEFLPLTLLAHGTLPVADDPPGVVTLTSDALAANIAKTGTTRMVLRFIAATEYGGAISNGEIAIYDASDPENIVDLRPYLTIEYTAAGGADTLVQPAAAAVALGTVTPAIVAQNWPRISPAAAAATVAGATPDVAAHRLIQPAAASLTVSAATPAVNAVATTVVQPAAATVTVTTATPALAATQTYIPAAAAVSVAGATPAVVAWAIVQPAAAALTVTGVAPTVAAHRLVQPAAAAVAITGATAAIAALQTYHPAAASLTVATATPAVSAVMTTVVGPAAAIVAIGTATPAVTATENAVVQPAAAALEFAGVAADVTATANVIIFPGPLGLVIDTATPLVVLPKRPLGLAASMRLVEIPVRSQISASYDTQIADGRLAA